MGSVISTKTIEGICTNCDKTKTVSLVECDSPHAGKIYCCKRCVAGGISATAHTIEALNTLLGIDANPLGLKDAATSMLPQLKRLYRELLYFALLEEEKEESARPN